MTLMLFMGQTTIQFIRNENKGDTALLYMSNPIGTITKPYHAVTVMVEPTMVESINSAVPY